MPHIHNEANQHDMTISAYIVRKERGAWKCLVHFHKKIEALMQIGGHIELDETPWQTAAHELEEESGYGLSELDVLQYTPDRLRESDNITHPTPFLINTHNVGNEHYHSDLCFAFEAKFLPQQSVASEESADLRWLDIEQLRLGSEDGTVLKDVYYIYDFLIDHSDQLVRVPATDFSLEKPVSIGLTYKRGAPGKKV